MCTRTALEPAVTRATVQAREALAEAGAHLVAVLPEETIRAEAARELPDAWHAFVACGAVVAWVAVTEAAAVRLVAILARVASRADAASTLHRLWVVFVARATVQAREAAAEVVCQFKPTSIAGHGLSGAIPEMGRTVG